MGSFNATCMASGQTIAPGDECYVLPVIQASRRENVDLVYQGEARSQQGAVSYVCYPNGFWTLFGNFLTAKYDDYGRVELKDTAINRIRLFSFLMRLYNSNVVTKQGSNSHHDLPFDFQAYVATKTPLLGQAIALLEKARTEAKFESRALLDDVKLFREMTQAWRHFEELSGKGRVFAVDGRKSPLPLHHAIVHARAFENLVELWETTPDWNDEVHPLRPRVDEMIGKLFDPGKALDKVRELVEKEGHSTEGRPFDEFAGLVLQPIFEETFQGLCPWECSHFGTTSAEVRGPFRARINGELTNEELYTAVRPAYDSYLVIGALSMLGMQLTPVVYASQDYDNKIGELYAKFVQKTCEAVCAERREDEESDKEVDA